MRPFRELRVWQRAHELALTIYKATSTFPKDELYGLTSQLRRAATSVPTNIAEGCGRDTTNELVRFCHIAGGSASELEYLLLLGRDLGLLSEPDYDSLAVETTEVKRMLTAFVQRLTAES